MIEEVKAFQTDMNKIFHECGRFNYFTRAREFQEESSEQLALLLNTAVTLKEKCILAHDEDLSNRMLCFQAAISSMHSELLMCISLKDENTSLAWNNLIEAQDAARAALLAHEAAEPMIEYIERLYIIEKVLFPPMQFLSPGFIIKASECSICGADYGNCHHISGRPYMGKLCFHNPKEFDIVEVSLVDAPADKRRRVITFTEGNIKRDMITWRELPQGSVEQANSISL